MSESICFLLKLGGLLAVKYPDNSAIHHYFSEKIKALSLKCAQIYELFLKEKINSGISGSHFQCTQNEPNDCKSLPGWLMNKLDSHAFATFESLNRISST
jgi:hypothetical protein